MAWELLPVNYKDAIWSGLKKYKEISNNDGTVSFEDLTDYVDREYSFFGAKDANRMNEALNTIMSMVENGTDLYEAFQNYFEEQKRLFEEKETNEYNEFVEYTDNLKSEGNELIDDIKTDYKQEIDKFEKEQEDDFNEWFREVKDQLSDDVAGNLQNQCNELDKRMDLVEENTSLIDTKADKQTLSGGFVAGRNAEVSTIEGTMLEYMYIGQYEQDGTKLSYIEGVPSALYDDELTIPVNSKNQLFNVFDLGVETNISSVELHVSDNNGSDQVRLFNDLTNISNKNDILRTNGAVQNGVPILENTIDSNGGFIKVGYTDGRYIGKYRYIAVFNWSIRCAATELYVETETNETMIPAIQLGEGKNENPYTIQVYDYQLLDENGRIPAERTGVYVQSDAPSNPSDGDLWIW